MMEVRRRCDKKKKKKKKKKSVLMVIATPLSLEHVNDLNQYGVDEIGQKLTSLVA